MIGSGILPATNSQASDIKNVVDTINGKVALDATVAKEATLTPVADEVTEIEHHIHNIERWVGNGGSVGSLTGYTLVSGNGDFGSEVAILTDVQTPVQPNKVAFDLHRAMPLTMSSATVYYIRVIYGTGTVGDAEAAGQYSDFPIISTGLGANVKGTPNEIKFPKLAVGTKIWAKCKNATNLASVVLLFGLHEYDA